MGVALPDEPFDDASDESGVVPPDDPADDPDSPEAFDACVLLPSDAVAPVFAADPASLVEDDRPVPLRLSVR